MNINSSCWWYVLQIFPLTERIENINDQYWTLRAEEVCCHFYFLLAFPSNIFCIFEVFSMVFISDFLSLLVDLFLCDLTQYVLWCSTSDIELKRLYSYSVDMLIYDFPNCRFRKKRKTLVQMIA